METIYLLGTLILIAFILFGYKVYKCDTKQDRLNIIENLQISENDKDIWYNIFNSNFNDDRNFFKSIINIFFNKITKNILNQNINQNLINDLLFKYSIIEEGISNDSFFDYNNSNYEQFLILYNSIS